MQKLCIYSIVPCGGMFAGDPFYYDLHLPGSIMTVRDDDGVNIIRNASADARKHGWDVCEYVAYIFNGNT